MAAEVTKKKKSPDVYFVDRWVGQVMGTMNKHNAPVWAHCVWEMARGTLNTKSTPHGHAFRVHGVERVNNTPNMKDMPPWMCLLCLKGEWGGQECVKHEKHVHRTCFSYWRLYWNQECIKHENMKNAPSWTHFSCFR